MTAYGYDAAIGMALIGGCPDAPESAPEPSLIALHGAVLTLVRALREAEGQAIALRETSLTTQQRNAALTIIAEAEIALHDAESDLGAQWLKELEG